jgi:hypothetical protein
MNNVVIASIKNIVVIISNVLYYTTENYNKKWFYAPRLVMKQDK